MDRRTFLTRSATVGAGAAAFTLAGGGTRWGQYRAVAEAAARTAGSVVAPDGTTLVRTLEPGGSGPYRRFVEGPAWPLELRDELAAARDDRVDRREPLATLVHLTDVHVIDGQSPTRVEFTDRLEDPSPAATGFFSSAWRPQETLTGQVADAMARQLRDIGVGPVTGRPFDAAVTTGDSTDNQQRNELDWFLALMDGGRPVSVNSGDPDRYEGVQDDDGASFDPAYYHPGGGDRVDRYRADLGYPDRPELLDAAIAAFTPVGLPCPWYSVYGNHDGLIQGNALANPVFDAIATGPLKVVGLPDGLSPAALAAILGDADLGRLLTLPHAPFRLVTPDEDRAAVSPREWVLAHLADRGGPGPVGHGLTADAAETGDLHYTFEIAPDVLGVALDSVNRTVWSSGSLDRAQFAWLEATLVAASSRHLDVDGREVRTGNADRYVVLFAHHTTATMDNAFPDATRPDPEGRVLGPELIALLHRFPNVVAMVVGHTHRNEVIAHASPGGGTGGFWEVTTAAHVDHPQQSRILELVDNRDGTLSLFGTLVDHAGPATPPDEARGVVDLASLSRELAVNDVQKGDGGVGHPRDRNVELLLAAPFTRDVDTAAPGPGTDATADDVSSDRGDGPPRASDGSAAAAPSDGDAVRAAPAVDATPVGATAARGPLPVTGPVAPVAAGAALVGAALRLRRGGVDRS